jgi:hypothetical protein
MFHSRCLTSFAAPSQTQGMAAALCNRGKYQAHKGLLHLGQKFVIASVAMYVHHFSWPIAWYLHTLNDVVWACSITQGWLLAIAHRELITHECGSGAVSGLCERPLRAVDHQGFGPSCEKTILES